MTRQSYSLPRTDKTIYLSISLGISLGFVKKKNNNKNGEKRKHHPKDFVLMKYLLFICLFQMGPVKI